MVVQYSTRRMDRETITFDVLVIGAGPAGLATAIHLKKMAASIGRKLSVCILEKGSEVGAHILSGAVIEPRALTELLPDWQVSGAPLGTPVTEERFLLLTASRTVRLPIPLEMHNTGNYIISLGELCRWLGQQAEALGVEIFPGFAAVEVLYAEDGSVCGVATGDMGIDRDGRPTPGFQPGIEVHARYTILAEGSRGSLSGDVIHHFALQDAADPQFYSIGIKELWEVRPDRQRPGLVIHSVGWPLANNNFGGGFLYHSGNNRVAVGLVVGLSYRNPWLSPFEEFQRLKLHPAIRRYLAGGRRIGYGARTLTEGGIQALPKLEFPGGMLVGDGAGFLNVAKAKGIHTAMKSGMLAAEAVYSSLCRPEIGHSDRYSNNMRNSWLWRELHAVRNIRPAFEWGLWSGMAYVLFETYLARGRVPWTLHHHVADYTRLQEITRHKVVPYPKHDGELTFDRPSSVFLANVHHVENQRCHL